jgi:hypothetical protein
MIMRAWFTLQIEGREDAKNKMKDLGSGNIAFSSPFWTPCWCRGSDALVSGGRRATGLKAGPRTSLGWNG